MSYHHVSDDPRHVVCGNCRHAEGCHEYDDGKWGWEPARYGEDANGLVCCWCGNAIGPHGQAWWIYPSTFDELTDPPSCGQPPIRPY